MLDSSFAGFNICWIQVLLGSRFAGFKFCRIQLLLDSVQVLLDSSFAEFNFCWIQVLVVSIMSLTCRLMGFPGAECLPRVYSGVRV